jgi:radical SAM superfamily enzyme YgiQ (UPF0313 family)
VKRRVVLYNPRAVFFTMPLALLAIGSRLDRRRYDVRIVDGRLESDPVAATLAAIDDETVCLGVTVLTGAPILDALEITRAVRTARPSLPVVWGGWHPSLFAEQTMEDASVDAVVVGQGEDTFADIVDRLSRGERATGVQRRPIRDINAFPAHDFALLSVERYFLRKQRRQVDYISSQGCRFRCTFCADPAVYQRSWFGLEPTRVGDELETLHRRHGATDVNFQDETFFTSASRVAAIVEELQRRGLALTWAATMRADQGARLDDGVLAECRAAGLRRVMVGVESGLPETLEWMKKDVTIEQVFVTADKCRRLGIGAIFNLIVGFPHEPAESVRATLAVARRLRSMSDRFEVAIFYFKPYPGNPIATELALEGYRFPERLSDWAAFDYVGSSNDWLDRHTISRVEAFKFYQRVGWSNPSPFRTPLQKLARWRCEHERYGLPLEKTLIEWWRPGEPLS